MNGWRHTFPKDTLRDIAASENRWATYWRLANVEPPTPFSHGGGIARRLIFLVQHQEFQVMFHSTLNKERKEFKKSVLASDFLTPKEIQDMLRNSNMWYAYVEKHSYFKPQSFAKLSDKEKRALIVNHQKMLQESYEGEIPMFNTDNEKRNASIEFNGTAGQNKALIDAGEFAMIFVEGGQTPQALHFSEETLNKEVDRLARETKKRVFILRPVEVREVELAPVKSVMLTAFPVQKMGGETD